MKVKMEIEVSEQLIKDMLVTGLEGAINYWAICMNFDEFKYDYSKFETNDFSLILNDAEDVEEELGKLNRDGIVKGIKLMAANSPEHFADMMAEAGDATTGDVFIQYAVLGEIVYG